MQNHPQVATRPSDSRLERVRYNLAVETADREPDADADLLALMALFHPESRLLSGMSVTDENE